MKRTHSTDTKAFTAFASSVARASGKPSAFAVSLAVVVAWAVSGPAFGCSDTWQLIINTATTIVTFLMVFLIQNTQNSDGAAIQIKLDGVDPDKRGPGPLHRHRKPVGGGADGTA